MKKFITILFMILVSISYASEQENFEEQLVQYTISKLEESSLVNYSLFPTLESAAIVKNSREQIPASPFIQNQFLVDQISAAIVIRKLKEDEFTVNRLLTAEMVHGNKNHSTYSYRDGIIPARKTETVLKLEARKQHIYKELSNILTHFPLLLSIRFDSKITTTDTYEDLIDLLKENNINSNELYTSSVKNSLATSEFLMMLLEVEAIKNDAVEIFNKAIYDAVVEINESIEEIKENNARALIRNTLLLESFWNESFQFYTNDRDIFNKAQQLLLEQYPESRFKTVRLFIGTGVFIAGVATSFTGGSIAVAAAGLMIIGDIAALTIDGIEAHNAYENNQINSGLFLSRLITQEEHIKVKKELLTHSAFVAIDIATLPMDYLRSMKTLRKFKTIKSSENIDEAAKFKVTTGGNQALSSKEFVEKGITYKSIIFKKANKKYAGFELMPSDSTPLNKYIAKVKTTNPDVRFIYSPDYLGIGRRGAYDDSTKMIFVGPASIKTANLPTYLD